MWAQRQRRRTHTHFEKMKLACGREWVREGERATTISTPTHWGLPQRSCMWSWMPWDESMTSYARRRVDRYFGVFLIFWSTNFCLNKFKFLNICHDGRLGANDKCVQSSIIGILYICHSNRTRSAMAYAVSRILLYRFDGYPHTTAMPSSERLQWPFYFICCFCLFMHARPVYACEVEQRWRTHTPAQSNETYEYNRLQYKSYERCQSMREPIHTAKWMLSSRSMCFTYDCYSYLLPDGMCVMCIHSDRVIVLHVAVFPFFYFVFFVIAPSIRSIRTLAASTGNTLFLNFIFIVSVVLVLRLARPSRLWITRKLLVSPSSAVLHV